MKKTSICFRSGRGVKQKSDPSSGNRLASPDQGRYATTTSHINQGSENQPMKRKRKSLPKIGWPIWHRGRLCKLNRRLPRFRTLNWQTLGFRTHIRKLNRQTLGTRNFGPEQYQVPKCLATCSHRDMNQRAKFKQHPAELRSHTKFNQLNRLTGNRNRGAATAYQHSSVNVKDLRSRSRESSRGEMELTKRSLNTGNLTGAHHQFQPRQRLSSHYTVLDNEQVDTRVNKTATSDSDNDHMRRRHAIVVNYYDQCRTARIFDVGTPLIGRHASAAGWDPAAAPPIWLNQAKTITESSGTSWNASTDATLTETEMKKVESSTAITSQQKAYTEDSDKPQRAKVNKRSTTEKAETEIQQKPEITISVEKSFTTTRQNVQSAKVCQTSATARKTTRRPKKTKGRTLKATTKTPTMSSTPEASEDDVTKTENRRRTPTTTLTRSQHRYWLRAANTEKCRQATLFLFKFNHFLS